MTWYYLYFNKITLVTNMIVDDTGSKFDAGWLNKEIFNKLGKNICQLKSGIVVIVMWQEHG